MRVIGILGILIVLGAAVAYIDRNAVARVEGKRVIESLARKAENARTAREVAEATAAKGAARATALEAKLAALPPPPAPLGKFCRPGCTIRWSDQ